MTSVKNATAFIFALATITIGGIIVLVALNKTVPSELWYIAVALLSGGLGIATPIPGAAGEKPTSSVPPGSAG